LWTGTSYFPAQNSRFCEDGAWRSASKTRWGEPGGFLGQRSKAGG